jgi:hypothetical protein
LRVPQRVHEQDAARTGLHHAERAPAAMQPARDLDAGEPAVAPVLAERLKVLVYDILCPVLASWRHAPVHDQGRYQA